MLISGEQDVSGKSVIDTLLIPAKAVPATRSTVFTETGFIFENNRDPKYVDSYRETKTPSMEVGCVHSSSARQY